MTTHEPVPPLGPVAASADQVRTAGEREVEEREVSVVTLTEFLPHDPTPTTKLVFSTADPEEITDWLDDRQYTYQTAKRTWGVVRGPDTLMVTDEAGHALVWRALRVLSDHVRATYGGGER